MFARSRQPVDNLYAAFYDLAVNLSTGETEGRMAEKIKHTYTVGDQTFDTYAEAVQYRKTITRVAFTLRLPPALAHSAAARASEEGCSLNDWMLKQLTARLGGK